jgi:hypothetical protein
MIKPDQHSLIFAKLELNECQKVVAILKSVSKKEQDKHDLDWWIKEEKRLLDKVFELEVLQGVSDDVVNQGSDQSDAQQ